jgi:hypothetical protein
MTEIRRLGRLSPVTDFLVCALDVIFCDAAQKSMELRR